MSEMDIECSTDDDALSARFPVHRACRDGDVGALYSLLLHPTTTTTGGGVNHQEDLTTEDSCCEWTPIHWAAHFGKLECVVHLVRVGCDVNAATTRLAHTPVHTATFGGHPECVLWLLQAGADVNRQDYVGESPIHKAARAGSIECVRTLLIHGATPDLRSSSGLTAADLAYAQGFWDCFQLLSNAQNHLVQLSRSLAVGALTGSGVPHHGPLSGVGNRKRLVDELGSICIKKARTDNDPKGLFNGHRKPACAARNGHTGVPPQTTAPLDECTGTPSPRGPSAPAVVVMDDDDYDDEGSAEDAARRRSANMCGSLHRAGSPGVCVSHSRTPWDLGDLLHYGHYHGFGDTAEDITTCGTPQ